MNDTLTDAVVRAVRGMEGFEPQPLLDDVMHHLRRSGLTLTEDELVEMVTAKDPNDTARLAFHVQLNRWDAADGEGWSHSTQPRTSERRDLVLERLELGPRPAKLRQRRVSSRSQRRDHRRPAGRRLGPVVHGCHRR